MKCAECGCYDQDAVGWVALLGLDPDDEDAHAEVVAFCPVCAAREFRMAKKTVAGYI